MYNSLNFLWNSFFSLTGWEMVLWVIYLLYFIYRTGAFYSSSSCYGVVQGYRLEMFGRDQYVRLWHIIRIVWDLPMAAIGLFLPLLSQTLTLEVCLNETAKEKEDRLKREAKMNELQKRN